MIRLSCPPKRATVCLSWLCYLVLTLLLGCSSVPKGTTPATASAAPPLTSLSAPKPPPPPAAPLVEPAKPSRLSLRLDKARPKAVLSALARQTQRRFTWLASDKPRSDKRLTMELSQARFAEVIEVIGRSSGLAIEFDQHTLVVTDDVPYLRVYTVNYLNIARRLSAQIDLSTQIDTLALSTDSQGGSSRGNNSWASVNNQSEHQFWQQLGGSIEEVLHAELGERFALNPEAGLLQVVAHAKAHRSIETFLQRLMGQLWRQVMIEATVVEVSLSEQHQSGVDWRRLSLGEGLSVVQLLLPNGEVANSQTAPVNAVLSYQNTQGGDTQTSLTIKALSAFGEVKVLSRPSIIAMNNQPAMLKVVDNRVYFTSRVDRDFNDEGELKREAWETRVNTVPVGLVMNVVPYISDDSAVMLNVRPTISRIIGFINDPNPALAASGSGVVSAIPELQVREMESVLRLQSGQTAVIGGLMQSERQHDNSFVPLLARLPVLGRLFRAKDQQRRKTELLIFLKPTVIDSAPLSAAASGRFEPTSLGQH